MPQSDVPYAFGPDHPRVKTLDKLGGREGWIQDPDKPWRLIPDPNYKVPDNRLTPPRPIDFGREWGQHEPQPITKEDLERWEREKWREMREARGNRMPHRPMQPEVMPFRPGLARPWGSGRGNQKGLPGGRKPGLHPTATGLHGTLGAGVGAAAGIMPRESAPGLNKQRDAQDWNDHDYEVEQWNKFGGDVTPGPQPKPQPPQQYRPHEWRAVDPRTGKPRDPLPELELEY